MQEHIQKAKRWIKDHPTQSAFAAGIVVGAALTKRSIKGQLVPGNELDKASFYIPEPYFEGLMEGAKIKLNTDLGSFSLVKL